MFSHSKGNSGKLRNIQALLRHIRPYLKHCVTLAYTTVQYSEPWHIYNPKHLQKLKHVGWSGIESWHSQSSLFKHFHSYFGIFRDIEVYSVTLTDIQLGEGRRPPLLFFEIWKKCPDFGKKGPDCVNLWVKFSIQNIVLRVSARKNSKMFPSGAFFHEMCFWWNAYQSALVPWNLPCREKCLVVHLHSVIILFVKYSIVNVWQASRYFSVSITAQ